MVARSVQELSSYQHLIHVAAADDDEYQSHEPILYYDLQPVSQSCCSNSLYFGNGQIASGEMAMEIPQVDSSQEKIDITKRKETPSYHEGSDDITYDDNKSTRTDDHKKQNHSEIEKRRRDKMNTYITELSALVPMCHAMSRKLDKLTVLRMAVQHVKTIKGAVQSFTDGKYKPSFLSDIQFKQLIKQSAEGFLFVVGCDRGRFLYVSESVTKALNYLQSDLLGQSWFDILHPKDVAKVKEQLSSSHLSTRERLIDAKTMLPLKTDMPQSGTNLCPGARRSFFCRMKCKTAPTINEEADTTTGCHKRKKQQSSDKKYTVIQCTGYLKPWTTNKIDMDDDKESDIEGDPCNLSCLVAMGRVMALPFNQHLRSCSTVESHPIKIRPVQFISRHAMDGKFLFVDQTATLVLGFLPQELFGSSMYEYYHKDDISHLAESHKIALQSRELTKTKVYRFRCKNGTDVHIQSEWKLFVNPWTKEAEYLVAKNSRITTDGTPQVESSVAGVNGKEKFEFYRTSPSMLKQGKTNITFFLLANSEAVELSTFMPPQIEASNIGRKIAHEVIDEQRKALDSPAVTPPTIQINNFQSPNVSPQAHSSTGVSKSAQKNVCIEDSYTPVRNNVTLSSAGLNFLNIFGTIEFSGEGDDMMDMIGSAVSPQQVAASVGNDEAAMAVIMSLLEADAGLGGPVDYTGLPWPLP